MTILKQLFETINQKAFNLQSSKEVYTIQLTEDQKSDRNTNYISGFQLLDKSLRITIIEGLTQQGLQQVKDALPKTAVNSSDLTIFSDDRILFDYRSFADFGLCLKFIKLRSSLNTILTTYDIYSKAKKYPEIYSAFMNFAGILRGPTLEIINNAKLIPSAKELLMLERQYGDILSEEDMTGVKVLKRKKKKIDLGSVMGVLNTSGSLKSSGHSRFGSGSFSGGSISDTMSRDRLSGGTGKGEKSSKGTNSGVSNAKGRGKLGSGHSVERGEKVDRVKMVNFKVDGKKTEQNNNTNANNPNSAVNPQDGSKAANKPSQDDSFANSMKQVLIDKKIIVVKKEKKSTKSKLDARNNEYVEFKKNFSPRTDHHFRNLVKIEALNRIVKSKGGNKRFCSREVNSAFEGEVFPYSSQRKNYWVEYMEQLRLQYGGDINSYYTYSKDFLQLKLPLFKNIANPDYVKEQENKMKWVNSKDFDRYKDDLKREFIYFPRLKQEF